MNTALVHGTTVQLLMVTPLMAQQWLENNNTNRTLRKANVIRLANEIIEGRWVCDPALPPIAIGDDGQVLNGQHRLHAVVKSGVSVRMYVAFNVPAHVMGVVDQAIPRSAADVFNLKHHIPNSKNVAASVNAYHRWMNYPELVWQNWMTPSPEVLVSIYELNVDEWQEAMAVADRVYRNTRLVKAATCAVAFRVQTEGSDPAQWFDFVEGVATGIGLTESDPRLALRSWAINATRKWGVNQWAIVGITTAWNAYVDSRPLRQIKSRVDMLPMKAPK